MHYRDWYELEKSTLAGNLSAQLCTVTQARTAAASKLTLGPSAPAIGQRQIEK